MHGASAPLTIKMFTLSIFQEQLHGKHAKQLKTLHVTEKNMQMYASLFATSDVRDYYKYKNTIITSKKIKKIINKKVSSKQLLTLSYFLFLNEKNKSIILSPHVQFLNCKVPQKMGSRMLVLNTMLCSKHTHTYI